MANKVGDQYKNTKEAIQIEIKEAMKFSKVAIALDIWQDNIKNTHHLGATCHYLKKDTETEELKLMSRVLKLWPMDPNLAKDAPNINDAINEILADFDLMDDKDDIIFITDRGGNLVNSLEGYNRRSCLNHFINNMTKKAVSSNKVVTSMKVGLTRLIKYFKSSGRTANFSENLILFATTRWNSLYSVLESFLNVFDEVRDNIPPDNIDMHNRFNRMNKVKMAKVKDFLEPFYKITKELEYDEEVTATRILPCFELLINHLSILETDIAEVKEMKTATIAYFEKNKDVLPGNYRLWAFFDPRYRHFNKFKTLNPFETMQSLRTYASIYFDEEIEAVATDSNNNTHPEASTNSLLSQFEDSIGPQNNSSIQNEIDIYLKMPFEKNETILGFWSKQSKHLPKLYKFCCSIAAIPATSGSVERMFSNCGNIITVKRNKLTNNAIDQLAFLHKNFKK